MLAFQKYSVVKNAYDFVKFDNFKKVLRDMFSLYVYKSAFGNSLKYYLGSLLVSLPCGLLFSYYIFKKRLFSGLMKVVLFLPSVMPVMVLVVVYQMVVNCVIPDWFGIVPLLSETSTKVWGTVFVFNIWVGFGTSVLLYVGAMSNVAEGTLEAAQIDGVNSLQEFFFIVFPQIFSTVSVFLVTGIAGLFVNQYNIYSFFAKGAEHSHYTVGYYMYLGIQDAGDDYGYWAALGVLMTIVVVPLTVSLRRLFNRIDPMTDKGGM